MRIDAQNELAVRPGAAPVTPVVPARSVPVTLVMVFGVMLLSKALGFATQVVVTGLIGTTGRADAYYFALSLVTVVSALVFGSAGSVLIPLYVEKREREGTAEASRFAGVVLTYLTLALVVLSLLLAMFARPLVVIFGRFPAEVLPLAVRVFAFTAPLAVLIGVGQLLMAMLQARKRFIAPALMGVLHSIVFLVVIAAAWSLLGIYALVLGATLSLAGQAAVMLWRLAKQERFSASLRWGPGEVHRLWLFAWPLLMSQMLSTMQVVASRKIASGLLIGAVSALAYAEALKAIFLDLCVAPVAQVSLVLFSEKLVRGEKDSAWEQLQQSLAALWFLIVPVVVILLVAAGPLVQLLYQRGAFTAESTALTASALTFFSLGLLGEGPYYLVSRFYLANREAWILTCLGLPFTGLYVFLLYFLSRIMGIIGIALGHSLVMIVALVVAVLILRLRSRSGFDPSFLRGLGKIAASGLAMLLATRYAVSRFADMLGSDFPSRLLMLFLVAGLGTVLYSLMAVLLGTPRDLPLLEKFRPGALLRQCSARYRTR